MKKHFEAFQDFIEPLNFQFSVICLSKIWLRPHDISNSNVQLPGYYSFHQTRENHRGGGFCFFFFLQQTCSYKVRKDLQVNSKAFECLCVEVENKKYYSKISLSSTKR